MEIAMIISVYSLLTGRYGSSAINYNSQVWYRCFRELMCETYVQASSVSIFLKSC